MNHHFLCVISAKFDFAFGIQKGSSRLVDILSVWSSSVMLPASLLAPYLKLSQTKIYFQVLIQSEFS